MQYNGTAMRWKTHVLFLWIWLRSTEGISAYLPCQQTTNLTELHPELKKCTFDFKDGYLHAFCPILVDFPGFTMLAPIENKTMTMEQILVSEKVPDASQGLAPACLFLRRVRLKKWDDFPQNLISSYDHVELAEGSNFGLPALNLLLVREDIRPITFDVTFAKPPLVAAVTRDSGAFNLSKVFRVYSMVDPTLYAFPVPDYFSVLANTTRPWNISIVYTDAVITLEEILRKIPTKLLEQVALTPIRHVAFHRCFFHRIWSKDIPSMTSIEHLEFSQSPIVTVHPEAFDLIPSVKKISLTGTKLPGVPEAIFSLKELASLNMSYTNLPHLASFDFWPDSRNRTSRAIELITSGTSLKLLRDRDLCGFPNLHELYMDRCQLTFLFGSPFICLKKLQILSLQANSISVFPLGTLEGLTGLLTLNLTGNRLRVFDGTKMLIPLVSLRILDISLNNIRKLRVDKPLNSSPEVIFANHNRIKKWTPPIFSRMTELKRLDLGNNEIAVLDNEMFSDLNGTQNVSLNHNPWDCYSCYLNNLHNFLDNHQMQCTGCVACKVPDEYNGYNVRSVAWREEECVGVDYYRVYVVPGILCIMSAAVLIYGAYKCRWYFIYVALRIKVGIKGYRRRVNVDNYAWDAFVSYHASDSNWVHNVLLHKLESPPFKFRLCVAERDFIPGVPITENICRAITQSRVCLFVLSPAFCRSRWCMFEVRIAQHGLPDREHFDSLIFIKKEQVRESEMSNTLLFLMKSRTYIEVPPSNATERRNNFFWLQLQAALKR